MAGLLKPYAGSHPITQGFMGTYSGERSGYVRSDHLVGKRTSVTGWKYYPHIHLSQDVGMPIGTDLLAPARMKLIQSGTYDSGEHFIVGMIRKDTSGRTLIFMTHLKADGVLVPVGRILNAGEHFAESGASGHVTGPHLHWQVIRLPLSIDPRSWGKGKAFDPAACLIGGSLAGSSWLIPNV